jgi:hypothetical protein
MAMQYDVKSVALAQGDQFNERIRIKGLLITCPTNGTIVLMDRDPEGNLTNYLFQITSPTVEIATFIPIPGEGILANSLYVVNLNNSKVTMFYG